MRRVLLIRAVRVTCAVAYSTGQACPVRCRYATVHGLRLALRDYTEIYVGSLLIVVDVARCTVVDVKEVFVINLSEGLQLLAELVIVVLQVGLLDLGGLCVKSLRILTVKPWLAGQRLQVVGADRLSRDGPRVTRARDWYVTLR